MCGIYGIISKHSDIVSKSINALYDLEYRGYDSSGIAFINEKDKAITTYKCTGKIDNLKQTLTDKEINTNTLIAHTRWATHGKISTNNAHPHTTENVAIVHNGILTNFEELKSKLNDYNFYGECDSEIIAKLIDYHLIKLTTNKSQTNNIKKTALKSNIYLKAFCLAINELKGSYAIACIFKDEPNTIFVAKKESPIYVCKCNEELFASSDLITFPENAKNYYEINDNEICEMKIDKIKFYSSQLKPINKKTKKYEINQNKVCLNNFKHFMLKEIFDIPKALKDTLKNLQTIKFQFDFNQFEEIHLIACGTAYHSACVGAFMIENIANIPAYSHIASDFIDSNHIISKKHLYVFISQSGETFDTIVALKKVKALNCLTLTITNTTYSTLASLSDAIIPIIAGKEVAVASTKVYNASNLACLYLAHKIKADKNNINNETKQNNENQHINESICNSITINYNELKSILNSDIEKEISKEIINHKTIFFIGKCEDYITAMEASLKLKEITYINCSAFPAGELKHGTLALVDNSTLVIAYLTDPKYIDKMLSTINEINARGGKVIAITSENLPQNLCSLIYKLPDKIDSINAMLYSIIPMQKVAYYTSIALSYSPDKPRNLAKSVTVG